MASVLLLVCAVPGCGREVKAPEAQSSVDVAAPMAAPASWSSFHGDSGLRGHTDTALAGTLKLRWRYASKAEVTNTPVAGDGRIYFANRRGTVYAVDLRGEEVWTRTLERAAQGDAAPAPEVLDAPLLYHAGRVIAAAADGALYALDGATGEVVWRVDVDAALLGSPAADKDRLYLILQDEGILQSRSVDTGALAWESEAVARCDGPPSLGPGFAVFGSCDAALHVRSRKDGATRFDIPIDDDSQVAGGVAIDGADVFSGSRSGAIVHANATSGKTVWINRDSRDEVFTTPAVSPRWVVVAARDGRVLGIDRKSGETQWRFDTEGEPRSPVIAGDTVVVTADGTLFLLRLEDGTKRWSYPVSDTITSPAVVGDMVVVGCDDGSVAAFGPA